MLRTKSIGNLLSKWINVFVFKQYKKIKLYLSKQDNLSDYIVKQICRILILNLKCDYCPIISHTKFLNDFLYIHQRKLLFSSWFWCHLNNCPEFFPWEPCFVAFLEKEYEWVWWEATELVLWSWISICAQSNMILILVFSS